MFYPICNPVSLIKSLYDAKMRGIYNASHISILENIWYNLREPKAKVLQYRKDDFDQY